MINDLISYYLRFYGIITSLEKLLCLLKNFEDLDSVSTFGGPTNAFPHSSSLRVESSQVKGNTCTVNRRTLIESVMAFQQEKYSSSHLLIRISHLCLFIPYQFIQYYFHSRIPNIPSSLKFTSKANSLDRLPKLIKQ